MIRRTLLALTVAAGTVLLASAAPPAAAAAPLFAAASSAAPAAADGTQTVAATFDTAGILSLLVGTLLPLLVGLFTRLSLNAGVKALVLAALSAVTAVATQWLAANNNHQAFAWQAAVLSAFATFLVAVGSHYQLWKPSGLAYRLGASGPVKDPATITLSDLDYGPIDLVPVAEQLGAGPPFTDVPPAAGPPASMRDTLHAAGAPGDVGRHEA